VPEMQAARGEQPRAALDRGTDRLPISMG
jgi:hypothetical protein